MIKQICIKFKYFHGSTYKRPVKNSAKTVRGRHYSLYIIKYSLRRIHNSVCFLFSMMYSYCYIYLGLGRINGSRFYIAVSA